MREETGTDVLEIPGPDDFHLHLRQGEPLRDYAARLEGTVRRGLVMPNTRPPVVTAEQLRAYRSEINDAAPDFEPLMSFKITPSHSRSAVIGLKEAGAVAGKYYPEGVTTNSEDGLTDPRDAIETIETMQELDLVLCVHAEQPGAPVLDREREFHTQIEFIVDRFPELRIVIEHVSDAETVELVRRLPPRVAATVTIHHLLFTIDDLLSDGINPHLYCKPLLKQNADRLSIEHVVLQGHPRFFYGSDSAPHPLAAKECACGAAGVYSAPSAIPLLIEFFESRGALHRLVPFVSQFGADFYGIPRNDAVSRFVRDPMRVPELVDGVVPLAAGVELSWRPEAASRE